MKRSVWRLRQKMIRMLKQKKISVILSRKQVLMADQPQIILKTMLAIFGMVIIMMTERSQSPVHRENGEMQKPTAAARIMMR